MIALTKAEMKRDKPKKKRKKERKKIKWKTISMICHVAQMTTRREKK
jgi:hypothetical protein